MYQNCPVRNIQMMHWTILEKGNGGNGRFHVISFLAAVSFSLFIVTLWFRLEPRAQTRFLCFRLSLDFVCTAKHHPVPEIYDTLRAQTRLDLNSHISSNFMVGNVPPVGSQTFHSRFIDPNHNYEGRATAQSALKRHRHSKFELSFKPRKSSWMDIIYCQ